MKCSVCGSAVIDSAKFCPECGSPFSHKSSDAGSSEKKISKGSEKKVSQSNAKNKKEDSKKVASGVLSQTKLIYLVLFLLLAGTVIIISSGILDKPVVGESQASVPTNNPHAGVDLNSLNEIKTLEETLQKNPNDKSTLLQLAHLLNDSGFKDKAVERYNQYLKTDPKNADVLVDMGVCYYETGKNAEAISSMEKAIKVVPNHQIAHLNLGIVNMAAGNNSKAIEYWKKAVELNPTNEIGKRAEEFIKQH